jgi:hypothetical protein
MAFLLGVLILPCLIGISFAETKDPPLSAGAQTMLDHADLSFMTTALAREDNDIDYFDHQKAKLIPLPKEVQVALKTVVKKDYEAILKLEYGGSSNDKSIVNGVQPLRELYGTIFRLDRPDHLQLYAVYVDLYGSLGGGYYLFILYDPATGKFTKDPAEISSHWAGVGDYPEDTPLVKPYVFFEDLFGGGPKEVVLEEFFHNGTESNAAIYHHYYIGQDLSFKEVLAVKTRFPTHWHTGDSEEAGYHFATVLRKVIPTGPNRISVETTMQMDDKSLVDVGTTFLKCGKPGEPFKISGEKVKNRRSEGFSKDVLWDRAEEY